MTASKPGTHPVHTSSPTSTSCTVASSAALATSAPGQSDQPRVSWRTTSFVNARSIFESVTAAISAGSNAYLYTYWL
ncbi:uncharacterized protein FOMMEDRAFT_152966 [Fomitiporia mediterranea MF3/22]|uniref:uncharacterized protein n=1 Tax=Fomitiporia mediterranea (strain MF3/22) TaxID=694068 RepID=UPI00044092FF|nr:uncharacterized protein FOMMEDRAFT_152966 [Fomitiporia mediterranea MF3/22]EJD05637.1 hypothetical protein FOMMEDRAFT_152966 [Fomitiporia mediterranea MF3/22]